MPASDTPQFAVSSWSLHRRIGLAYPDSPGRPGNGIAVPQWGPGDISILDFPADAKAHGFDRVEICHFHVPGREPQALAEMRAALASAGVTLQTLLIDDGDIAQAPGTDRDRDIAWVGGWIDAAAALGAHAARVVAGKQAPSPEALACSVDALRQLARRGREQGVRIVTENWFALTAGPREVYQILDRLDGEVGLLADTGNWSGPDKYEALAALFARAERCHAKASFGDGLAMDRDDYGRCMAAAKEAGYTGPMTLVFESAGEEWTGVEMERDFVREFWTKST